MSVRNYLATWSYSRVTGKVDLGSTPQIRASGRLTLWTEISCHMRRIPFRSRLGLSLFCQVEKLYM